MSGIILKAKAILSGIMAAPSSLNGYCSINATMLSLGSVFTKCMLIYDINIKRSCIMCTYMHTRVFVTTNKRKEA